MKTKTVTIENWDGSKYEVEAPAKARYVGIYCSTGHICFYPRKPRIDSAGYGHSDDMMKLANGSSYSSVQCPHENRPYDDGYGQNGMPMELILPIEEV